MYSMTLGRTYHIYRVVALFIIEKRSEKSKKYTYICIMGVVERWRESKEKNENITLKPPFIRPQSDRDTV